MSNTSSLFPDQPIPVPIPGKADLNTYYSNPSRSVPQVAVPEIRAYWASQATPLNFTAAPFDPTDPIDAQILQPAPPAAIGDITTRAIWKTPTFDLRPDLKGSGSYQPEARPINRSSDFGRGARLILTTSGDGLVNIPTGNFKVYSVEFGSTNNPRQMYALNARQEITSHFFDYIPSNQLSAIGPPGNQIIQPPASTLSWEPAGNPIRYWGVCVIFETIEVINPGLTGRLVCQGELL